MSYLQQNAQKKPPLFWPGWLLGCKLLLVSLLWAWRWHKPTTGHTQSTRWDGAPPYASLLQGPEGGAHLLRPKKITSSLGILLQRCKSRCTIWKTTMQHLWGTYEEPVQQLCNIISMQHLSNTYAAPVQHLCNTFARPAQHLCNTYSTPLQH